MRLLRKLKKSKKQNIEVAIVVGGGNIWRGFGKLKEWIEQRLTIWGC